MFQKVISAGILGIEGYLVSVEADARYGLPGFSMVGYLSGEVREAADRVKTALKNSGYDLPPKKVTINLSPADLRKEGTGYDLPIAVAVLGAYELVNLTPLKDALVLGELGLDGEIKPIKGILALVDAARKAGINICYLPKANALEGAAVQGIKVVPLAHLNDLLAVLKHPETIQFLSYSNADQIQQTNQNPYSIDYQEVNGQLLLKRATEVAVAGRHNILYLGTAGSGKTMIARRIPTIMPPLTINEKIEISKIYSICGLLPRETPLLAKRPFRSPHHTITPTALSGGGRIPHPGEISLASGGVLFLDELTEFSRHSIEILRQPLEDRIVTLSRAHYTFTFPAKVMLVAAMNPCPCGHYPDHERCRCSSRQIRQYLGKISKPILDRIDLMAEAAPVSFDELGLNEHNEPSAAIRKRVEKAMEIQQKRFCHLQKNSTEAFCFNSEMGNREIEQYCKLKDNDRLYLKGAFEKLNLSARAYGKILKVARTIADLDGKAEINRTHLSEAISYRTLENKFWKE